ncbi:MAG: sensor histidine kinase [Lachnospiraceae bacterium]|nr:sensor histidine kinase [Lachnospiraceae bacterium]
MSGKKEHFTQMFQWAMLFLNGVAVVFICTFIYVTTNRIRAHYNARDFLGSVMTIPDNPRTNLWLCLVLLVMLMVNFMFRHFLKMRHGRGRVLSLIVEILICVVIIYRLDFNYNGLLLLVFANVIAYVKDSKAKMAFLLLAIVGYLLADYELLSIYMPLFNMSDYVGYYTFTSQQWLLCIWNTISSLNIILFVGYCFSVINLQRGTIEEVNVLYHELQNANEQLSEYADMAEKMAQTNERNRLAREIHDTLGHSLTGIIAGLDACLALVDVAPQEVKKQLKLLADVSRDGMKDVRRSVSELRPDEMERLSLNAAVRKMVTDMGRVSDTRIYFDVGEEKLEFGEDEENIIYRVIQESITNAIRHGQAYRIWITLKRIDGEVLLEVKDDGIGCKEVKSGFGRRHMKERIEMLGGTIAFDGQKGFKVTAHIPIRWGESYD